jgi:hypothetical protein
MYTLSNLVAFMAIDSLGMGPGTAKSVESWMQCQQRIRSVAANER